MTLFFISMAIISCGGVLSLLTFRQTALSKIMVILLISTGCLCGLVDSVTTLMHPEIQRASISFLHGLSLSFKMDSLSAFFLAVIFLVSLLGTVYSYHYTTQKGTSVSVPVSYFFFSVLIVSMALVVTAWSIVTFMLCWELMSLSSFFLVISDYRSAENRKAALLYFVFSHIGAMFLLSAFGLVYADTGWDFAAMKHMAVGVKMTVFILTFIGFGSKAGIFPFHVWLPHAHPAAPTHISAVMSGVMIKTGIYGIIRIYLLLELRHPAPGITLLVAGAISGILGVVYALGQHDLKRLLAYHSVENIGIILMGLGVGMIGVSFSNPAMAVLGFSGGILHVLNHALFKSLLFMGAGMVLKKTGTRAIDSLGGLFRKMKVTGMTFLIGSLAICGLPPFNGFVSEFLIYMGGFKGILMKSQSGFVFSGIAIICLAVIGGLAMACFTKVFGVVFQGEPRTAVARQVDEKGWTMKAAMAVLALFCTLVGVFPGILMHTILAWIPGMLGIHAIPQQMETLNSVTVMANHISLGAAICMATLVAAWGLRWTLYKGKPMAQSDTWGCGFTAPTVRMQYTGSSYAAAIIGFFGPAAPIRETHTPVTGRFPQKSSYHSSTGDIAEIYMAPLVVRPILSLFDKLRWIQHGDIHLYIGYILMAIILLLFFL